MTVQFSYGPQVRLGPGCATAFDDLLPAGTLLIVTDRGVRAAGLLDPIVQAIEVSGRTIEVFDAVEADPSSQTVEAARAAARRCGVVGVIGLGGGSPMDVAKLTAYLALSPEPLDALWGVGRALQRRLPLFQIPTTAGTGSEATPVAIVSVGGQEKRGIVSPRLLADWAILDPSLTLGLPRAITAATGIDAIVHAIEAYTSLRLKNPLSDMLAREAIVLLAANVLTACDDPRNLTARQAMMYGAHLAGVAFANAPVAGVHALAYPLGSHFHIPHGASNALILPHVLRFNSSAAQRDYAELGVLLDPSLAGRPVPDQAAAFIGQMCGLIEQTGLPRRLCEIGVGADAVPLLATEALKQERLLVNNPVPLDGAAITRIYEAAL